MNDYTDSDPHRRQPYHQPPPTSEIAPRSTAYRPISSSALSPDYQSYHHEQPVPYTAQPRRGSLSSAYYASLFSAYRDDQTTGPPSPTTPSAYGDSRGTRSLAKPAPPSAVSSADSWETWPPNEPRFSTGVTAAGPATHTWDGLWDESWFGRDPRREGQAAPPSGMRTPPPTARVPAAAGGFPIQAHPASPQFWPQPWSIPDYETREQAPRPPAPPEQRTRYSVAGVILDEDDFFDYATSSLDWVDSIAAPETGPQASFVPVADSLALRLEGKQVAARATFYTQLLSPLEMARPASAPPEKSRSRAPAVATGHAGARVDAHSGDVFYQITNRRRSSSVDATVARAATSRVSAERGPALDPGPDPRRDSLESTTGRDGSGLSTSRPHHRGSMRGWVHYERCTSLAGPTATMVEDPPLAAHRSASQVPYPSPRPVTPTRGGARRAHSAQRTSPASAAGSRDPPAAVSASPHSPRRPPHSGGGGGGGESPSGGRRTASATRRPSSLSFVNFSSADARKLMKAVSKSGGVGKHKRASSHGRPGHKDDYPHL